ncbi:MAG: helix-turn-helix domain-containing protein [Desulfovibrio sp.]|jgi:transcriptional regulator with XRE-family HTH domain|nr:helix-turn-helix domain-containing protein [Desulfovibrio sp.]
MQEKNAFNWAMASVIHQARKKAGLTQVELADFSGLSKPYVSALERGNINTSVYALARVAEVLKIAPSELLARVECEIKKGPQKPAKGTGRPRNLERFAIENV